MEDMNRAIRITHAIEMAIFRGRASDLAELLGYEPRRLQADADALGRTAWAMPLNERSRIRLQRATDLYNQRIDRLKEKPDREGIAPSKKSPDQLESSMIEAFIADLETKI